MCCEICDKSVQQESVQQLCKKLCARAKMEYEIYSCRKCVASCVQEVYAVTVIETLYKRRKLHTKIYFRKHIYAANTTVRLRVYILVREGFSFLKKMFTL